MVSTRRVSLYKNTTTTTADGAAAGGSNSAGVTCGQMSKHAHIDSSGPLAQTYSAMKSYFGNIEVAAALSF